MNNDIIKKLLSGSDPGQVETFINYCGKLRTEQKKVGGQWVQKNPWMDKKTENQLAEFFKLVEKDGLEFDGKHITLQSTGVSYDYVAYKNKMLLVYPESLIDVQLVHQGDEFAFKKISGKVEYSHKINDPFGDQPVSGGYCVIKNSRGEFISLLSVADFEKHQKVAKTNYIWDAWPDEMKIKTLIKKACKLHFSDIFQTMETLDNEQNDLEQSLEISIETKQELEAIESVQGVNDYFRKNRVKNAGIAKDFITTCANRKAVIVKTLAEADEAKEENGNS